MGTALFAPPFFDAKDKLPEIVDSHECVRGGGEAYDGLPPHASVPNKRPAFNVRCAHYLKCSRKKFPLRIKKRSPHGERFLLRFYLSSAKYLIVRTIWLVYEFSLSYQETTLTSVLPSPMGIHLVCVASKSEP